MEPSLRQIPGTEAFKAVLEQSLNEALNLGHNWVSPEHILIALAYVQRGGAARILLDFDAGVETIRRRVIEQRRIRALKMLPDFLAGLRAIETDQYLVMADLEATPGGWDELPRYLKRERLLSMLARMDDAVLERLERLMHAAWEEAAAEKWDDAGGDEDEPTNETATVDEDGPIFVVHGHDHAMLDKAVRVLERATGREVLVLPEQPNVGRTILEKFEDHAAGAAYAVVLLTADDIGGIASEPERRPRGRQNVIFELGFFFGKLGRNRVAVLLAPGVEEPSDIGGLVYIPLDAPGAWKQAMVRELANVGIAVDYSRVP